MIHHVTARSVQREAVPSSLTSQLFSQGLKEPRCLQGVGGPSPLAHSSTGHILKQLHPARKGYSAPTCHAPTVSNRMDPLKQKNGKKWEEEPPDASNSLFLPTSESKPLTGLVCSSGSPAGASFAARPKPCKRTVVSEASWAAAPP